MAYEKIEKLRRMLNNTVEDDKNLTSNKILELSKKLDIAIVEYYKAILSEEKEKQLKIS